MFVLRAFLALLFTQAAFSGTVQLLANLPSGAIPTAFRLDASGNIYVAGSVTPQTPKAVGDTSDAFVAKLSPDGSSVIYFRLIAGSGYDTANALSLGPDGSVYVAGNTTSADLPTTPGALQTTLGATNQAFVAKLDPAGAIHYLTYLGGTSLMSAYALVLDAAGEVYVTGGFTVMKLDATGSTLLLSTTGFGGSLIALDNQGNIYVAGDDYLPPDSATPLATPGAFQTMVGPNVCGGTSFLALLCGFQYVQKADPTGSKIIFGTYIAGSFGATPAAMAVDASGNVILAGTTNSSDYPVTSGAFQTEYLANALPPPQMGFPGFTIYPPPASGYVTKLNATGTGLIWSTFFGGSVQDAISSMAVDAAGNVLVAGQANSPDLPGLSATPALCRPTMNQGLGFVSRISADGTSATPTQIIYGAPSCMYYSCESDASATSSGAWLMATLPDGTAMLVGQNGAIAVANLFAPERLACMIDFADNVQLPAVAPGQILTLLATLFVADLTPSAVTPPATSYGGFTVTFNGVAAPLLYVSGDQINLQVPYEVAGQTSVQLKIMLGTSVIDTRTLSVVPQQPAMVLAPSAFTTPIPSEVPCGALYDQQALEFEPLALALNADGTLNSCTNPAAAGSIVTLMLNGLGTNPLQSTGAIGPSQPVALLPGVTGAGVISTATIPGVIDGVSQVRVQLPSLGGPLGLSLSVNGMPVRQPTVQVWMK